MSGALLANLLYNNFLISNHPTNRTWRKFNEAMARKVEAAYQARATDLTPTLQMTHPIHGTVIGYKYDFSSIPMTQTNTSTGFSCDIRRGEGPGKNDFALISDQEAIFSVIGARKVDDCESWEYWEFDDSG